MKKRIFSMFLCLCMAFTLVSTMVPTASAVSQKPLTDEEITKIIKDYIDAVEAWKKAKEEEKKANGEKDTKVNNAYWNAGISDRTTSTNELMENVNKKNYAYGLTEDPCDYKNYSKAQHDSNGTGCRSNYFDGVSKDYRDRYTVPGVRGGNTQCSGFADYMEYVIFQSTGGSEWEKKDSVEDGYNFRPGDLVRYNGHSAVVYYVKGDNVYFIECNWTGGSKDYCIIRWGENDTGHSETQNDLKSAISKNGYIVRPSASLRVDSASAPSTPAPNNNSKPGAPSHLTGQWTSTGPSWQARISWTAGSGATRYEVQFLTPKAGETWKSDPDYKSGTSYISTGLGNYNHYVYRVRSANAAGVYSNWVIYVLSKPDTVTPPAKPNNVSAIWASLGNMSVRISWSAVSGAESYQVQYRTKGDSLWCSSGTIKSTSCTVSVSSTDDSYDIRVKAVNTAGSSDWAECSLPAPKKIVSVLQEKALPHSTVNAPAGVSGEWTSTGTKWQARISWNAVSGATGYEVQYRTPTTGNAWRTDGDYKSGTSYISTGLGNYNSYDYRVRAVNANGVSDWTEYTLVKTVSTPEPTPSQPTPTLPSAPSGVYGVWTSTGTKWQARISWNAVSGATRYEVQYRTPKTGNAWKNDADYSSGTSYISTGLGDYNSYDYRVRAINANGASEWTEYTLVKPASTQEGTSSQTTSSSTSAPPSAPSGISGVWTSTGPKWQARISWTPVSGATHYEVQYRTPKTGNSWKTDTDYSSGTSYISTGLGDYNSYDYRVRAVNANGASEWTEYTLIKTVSTSNPASAVTAPTAPTNVSGTWTSTGPNWQARISWNAVSGATHYEVQYRTPTTGNEWKADADYSSGTSYISTGLGNYSSYDYRVRAVNANGASGWTEYTLVKTVSTPAPVATAPAAPTNISGSWTSRGPNWQARISWNAVSGATRYEVQYRTPSTGNEWRADPDYSSGTSYISRGLGNYNSYDYRVRAVNANGASGWTEYTLYK